MAISELPSFFDMVYTKSDGRLAADGYLYNDQMFQSLNQTVFVVNQVAASTFKDIPSLTAVGINAPAVLGATPPSFTTAQINAINAAVDANGDPLVEIGTIWYDSDINKLKFRGAGGVIQTITSV